MSNANQKPLGLMPAPDAATVELLYRNLGNVPPPPREAARSVLSLPHEQSFIAKIISVRIQAPITRLGSSRKSTKFVYIHHVVALIEIRTYKADKELARPHGKPPEQR
ncbi:pyocin activator PrtN family protein [Pseudomonas sp. TMW22091]|uniref:pyocin activator PrtN family protein n=1 Tax=Pseudomonas sp. TMW22091 TaxID=2506435 RepID=UPI001F0E46DE|nr:pyocin activator PrtN family protein [Pseudomonas sp. TMW22091]MCH4873052.1 transcriptional regulator [Pseudomonas sp. TMW22091]